MGIDDDEDADVELPASDDVQRELRIHGAGRMVGAPRSRRRDSLRLPSTAVAPERGGATSTPLRGPSNSDPARRVPSLLPCRRASLILPSATVLVAMSKLNDCPSPAGAATASGLVQSAVLCGIRWHDRRFSAKTRVPPSWTRPRGSCKRLLRRSDWHPRTAAAAIPWLPAFSICKAHGLRSGRVTQAAVRIDQYGRAVASNHTNFRTEIDAALGAGRRAYSAEAQCHEPVQVRVPGGRQRRILCVHSQALSRTSHCNCAFAASTRMASPASIKCWRVAPCPLKPRHCADRGYSCWL